MDDDLKTSRHAGVVEAYDLDEGSASVRLDAGMTVFARITPAVRNVKVGNRVTLEKTVPGGVWRLVEKNTYDPPPKVSGSMGTKPANASTASTTTLRTPNSRPEPPNYPSSSSNGDLYFTLNQVVLFLRNANYNWTGSVNNAISDLRSAVSNTRSTLNTNATRLNQTRDYAGTAGDLVTPVVDVLDDQGVLKKGN